MKFLLVWMLLTASANCLAHDPGLSSLKLTICSNEVSAQFIFSRSDIESFFPIDKDQDGKISSQEFTQAKDRLKDIASRALSLTLDQRPVSPKGAEAELDNDNNCSFLVHYAGAPAREIRIESLLIKDLPPGHRQVASLYNLENRLMEEKLLTSKNNILELTVDQFTPPPPIDQGFWSFLTMGVEHILTGYDHLLFLFGLLVVCGRVSAIIRIITCFTLAHSITLALAATKVMTLSPSLVEPAIALSIFWVGVENIIRKGEPRGRALLTFCFGLIHGFGFAAALQERQIGEGGRGIAIPLLSFNLGVETGQILVAAVVLPILWKIRKKPWFAQKGVPILSAAIAAAGLFWFIQRVWF